jgi:hypothetical protein
MDIGIATRDITPQHPVRIATFYRTETFTAVRDPLSVRVAWFGAAQSPDLVLVNLDLTWVCAEHHLAVADRLGIAKERVMLNAVHTHSAPQSHPGQQRRGPLDERYYHWLIDRTVEACEEARANVAPTVVAATTVPIDFTVNRRRRVWYPMGSRIEQRPNRKGSRIPIVRALRLTTKDGALRALLLNGACHANCYVNNDISADFTGVLATALQEHWQAEVPVFWLQGCAGDVRPDLTERPPLSRPAAFLLSKIYDAPFAADVPEKAVRTMVESLAQALATSDYRPIRIESSGVARQTQIELFDGIGERHQLGVTYVNLGNDLAIIAYGAEMFSAFDKQLSAAKPNLWILGYTNELLGYVSTDQASVDGGYEIDKGNERYGIAAPFVPGVEATVMARSIAMMA